MGYLGASPVFPRTAFSLRLMRFHHTMWKFCAVRIEPFTRALDVYLDASCPLILSSKSMRVSPFTPRVALAFRLALFIFSKSVN